MIQWKRILIERSLEEEKIASSDFSQGCKWYNTGVFRSSRDRYLRTIIPYIQVMHAVYLVTSLGCSHAPF